MSKFWIIGPPGSGKSTLAKLIAEKKQIAWYELDTFFWGKNWEKINPIEVKKSLQSTVTNEEFVLDGYYEFLFDIIDTDYIVVFITKPLPILLFRILRRSFCRILRKEKVCGENYESLNFLFSKEGLFRYTISQFFFFRGKGVWSNYPQIVYIRNQKELNYFIDSI